MNPPALPGRQGAIYWAIVAFENEAPFHVVEAGGTVHHPTSADVVREVQSRRIASEFTLALHAKIRPVLVLQDRPAGRLPEHAALKLTRLEKFDPAEQQRIRNQEEPALFFLGESTASGLSQEHAVDLNSLVRVHETALVSRAGNVSADAFPAICERLVSFMDLDIRHLVAREAASFITRQRLAP